MNQPTSTILVIGGTRGTGQLIVQRLNRDGCRVRALVRNATTARAKLPPSIEVVGGDVTVPATLRAPLAGVEHIIFTAGVTQRPAPESLVRAIDFQGVVHTLQAATQAGFRGRFLYMNSIGIHRSSLLRFALDLVKRRVLFWRKRAEEEIRKSGIDYTIIRAGLLTAGPSGQRPVEIAQRDRPLTFRTRIARDDVAEVFLAALKDDRTRRTTFEVVWGTGPMIRNWQTLFANLRPDETETA